MHTTKPNALTNANVAALLDALEGAKPEGGTAVLVGLLGGVK